MEYCVELLLSLCSISSLELRGIEQFIIVLCSNPVTSRSLKRSEVIPRRHPRITPRGYTN
eukprot:1197998-Amorphochlora_amoeboformis.AAC.1